MRTGRQGGDWRTIVGVVGDVRTQALDKPAEPELYQAIGSKGVPALMLAVRTNGSPIAIAPAVRDAVWTIDRNVPVADLQSMRSLVGTTLAQPRLMLTCSRGSPPRACCSRRSASTVSSPSPSPGGSGKSGSGWHWGRSARE